MQSPEKRKTDDCKTCTIKKHEFSKKINKRHLKMAKTNLMNILRDEKENPMPLRTIFQRNEMVEIHRNKIKADYNFSSPCWPRMTRKVGEGCKVKRIEFSSSPNAPSLREQLKQFAKKHNPTSDMWDDLLNLMQRNGVEVPKNILIQGSNDMKENAFEVIDMTFGRYLNFGIEKTLKALTKKVEGLIELPEVLKLDIMITMIKSKPSENDRNPPHHLIILGRLKNCQFDESFIISVYRGSIPYLGIGNQILKPLYHELKGFESQDIELLKKSHKIRIHAFICDPVANSVVTCTALPTSVSGCSKCNQQGELQFQHEITSFPASAPAGYSRSDDDFKICIQNGHHLGVPILSDLNLGLVSQFAIDYKSFLCDGVMKTLMELWTKGKLDYRLNKEALRKISAEMLLIGKLLPREFKEKPKTMEELDDWTSYDWRNFLLYYGPVVLKFAIPNPYYTHFIYFHLAVRLVISSRDFHAYGTFHSGMFLSKFVREFADLYGPELIDYNIHNLLHIEDMTMRLGPLDEIGGFKYLQHLNKIDLIINEPLPSFATQIHDHSKMIFENKINTLSNKYPLMPAENTLIMQNYVLTNQLPDNHAITKDGCIQIEAICQEENGEIEIVGREYTKEAIFYEMKQTLQKFVYISDLSETKKYKVDDILAKGVAINTIKGLCVLPLLNL